MAALAEVARRRRWAPGPNARINWDHPLAQGLVGLVRPVGAQVIETISNRWFSSSGLPSLAASTFGVAAMSDGSGSPGTLTIGSSDRMSVQPPITVAFVADLRPSPANYTGYFGVAFKSPDAAPWLCYSLDHDGTGNIVKGQFNDSGNLTQIAPSESYSAGPCIALLTVNGTGSSLYRNGRLIGTGAGASAINYTTTSYMYVGSTTKDSAIAFTAGAIWATGLSTDEIALYSEQPFAMLTERAPRLYFYFTPPPAFTGTVAVTLADFTATASGTVAPPAFTGTSATTLADFTSTATGTHTPPAFTGTVAVTLADFTSTASGTNGNLGTATVSFGRPFFHVRFGRSKP